MVNGISKSETSLSCNNNSGEKYVVNWHAKMNFDEQKGKLEALEELNKTDFFPFNSHFKSLLRIELLVHFLGKNIHLWIDMEKMKNIHLLHNQ